MKIFMTGYSNLPQDKFIENLKKNSITMVIDIREKPYSRWQPWTSIKKLPDILFKNGIKYKWMGGSLGGSLFWKDGEECGLFKETEKKVWLGLEKVVDIAKKEKVCLMCACGNFDKCHRSIIAVFLISDYQVNVFDIAKDGSLHEISLT
ncbi:Protein of unknown function, DUF488 [Balnearium lithotrophicum]|uniref:DUF488 domain-containing protein n=1 Tax=Balnearium lithotrophicum TaxID=223788 RepID=A0A521CLY8_9BACT|nr:DUF488 domain-containing protein [Balnearium lithotrophicum]SMO59700.1 Protein of unknown function, DUF488 [Balnearium lithotrophicum]